MAKRSAALLLYRRASGTIEVFLVHPGGPFWARKDDAAWSLPKGEYGEGEDALAAAKREVEEETGVAVDGDFVALGAIRQACGKVVTAWAIERDLDASLLRSNTFSMEWPPKSGRAQDFPEVDRGGWFAIAEARRKVTKGQAALLDRLLETLGIEGESGRD